MNAELQALETNDTWEVTDLPPGRRTISCKWIFKTKYNSDGTVERHNARLVVLGCRQKAGLDYEETFAPVATMILVRALLVVAAMKGWHTCQMDVSNSFLHVDLFEEVYMRFPPGYTAPRCEITPASATASSVRGSGKVCRLLKSLYGLKQAPRQWFVKLSTALISFGFVQSKAYYSLFTKQVQDKFTTILIYVDDMMIACNNQAEILQLKQQLSSRFHMKDLGDLR